jgi:uncharacterized protein (TIGR03085 family)
MASHSAAERAALVDALTTAGPHVSTLCDGWTTTLLAAHLVTRERRPDAAVGILVPAMAGWNRRVQGRYAQRDYADLVEAIRNGPPRTSVMAIPGLDARLNLLEHFVHCEDVRRAGPNWVPRELPERRQRAFWNQVAAMGKNLFRHSPVSVTLSTPDGRTKQVLDRGDEGIDLIGVPGELVLYGFGRKDQAQVQIEGPDDAVAAFRKLTLKV